MKKKWKCKVCKNSFQTKMRLDEHWLGCWEKNQSKKYLDLFPINKNKKSKIHTTPVPIWIAEKNIKSKKNTEFTQTNGIKTLANHPKKVSPTIKTSSIESKCSCGGENENCFKCNGTGIYTKKIVSNIEECHHIIQEKQTRAINSNQESKFSNDQRGGIYGIRERGRFSSNPLYEEDI